MDKQTEKSRQFFADYSNFHSIDMTNFETFFAEYRSIKASIDTSLWEDLRPKLELLFQKYETEKKSILELVRQNADEYNIFDILKIRHLEAITHTPFLTNLLNPVGKHAQGDIFLKNFLCFTFPHFKNFQNYNPAHIFIKDEYPTSMGRIDIFIHHYDSVNPFAIIIENKIYAADQKNQMERYWEYAHKTLKLDKDRIGLVYLKDGSPPSHYSMNHILQDELKLKGNLVCIGYNQDLIKILETSAKEIKAENIRSMINQYLQIIKDI